MKSIVGFDPSLSGFGLAVVDGRDFSTKTVRVPASAPYRHKSVLISIRMFLQQHLSGAPREPVCEACSGSGREGFRFADGRIGSVVCGRCHGAWAAGRPSRRLLFVTEGYAYGYANRAGKGEKGRRSDPYSAGEARTLFHLVASEWNARVLVVPPATLKMFLTGNGRAKKEEMVPEMNELLGTNFRQGQHDQVDALSACCLGAELSGLAHPLSANMERRRLRALDSVTLEP